jgi:hypothetical protein
MLPKIIDIVPPTPDRANIASDVGKRIGRIEKRVMAKAVQATMIIVVIKG